LARAKGAIFPALPSDVSGGQKLIRYGISAGYSVVVQSPSIAGGTRGTKQEAMEVSSMPYVVLVPGYWWLSDVTATYCSSVYGDLDEAGAQRASFEKAKKVAQVGLKPDEQKAYDTDSDPNHKAVVDKVWEDAKKLWEPGKRGRCWPSKFGVYFGKPASYDGTITTENQPNRTKVSITPTASAGLAFLPNAWVTILVGVTVARASEPATSAAAGVTDLSLNFTTFTIGVGGNLDLLSAIFH
jgi:hypothetical protein